MSNTFLRGIDQIAPHIGRKCSFIKTSLKLYFLINLLLNLNYNVKTVGIHKAFAQYDKAENIRTSCLAPIKNVLNAPENILKLSDLLSFLNHNNAIAGYRHFNVNKNKLGILKYGVEDIERRLNILHV